MNMYTYQDTLPRLPLPSLDSTCQKLLEWSNVFLTEEESMETQKAVNHFRSELGMGPALQRILGEMAEDPDVPNWLDPLWAESYLCNPFPLPTGGNVTYIIDKNPSMKKVSVPEFVVSVIGQLFEFNGLVLNESLKIDFQGSQPLCMSQYKTLLGTTRIPGETQDSHIINSNASHVILIHRGHYYRLDILDQQGERIHPSTLFDQVQEIYNSSMSTNELAPGVLTSLPRQQWARLRDHLAEVSPENKESLWQVENALAVIVLDDHIPADDTQLFHHYFCGNPANRWYDKSLQFIFNGQGDFGVNYEHSGVDGTTVGHLISYLFQNLSPIEETSRMESGNPAMEITFSLDERLKKEIKSAAEFNKRAHDHLAFQAVTFSAFGKEKIKQIGVSPDSFVQLSIQLAQSKSLDRVYNVYESVMTKRFLHGRTETMRPVTKESLAFVQSPTLENLKTASVKHVERIKECQQGEGIDRHLYGLKKIHEKHYPDRPLPDLFTSAGYKAITVNHFSTSTSNSAGIRYAGYGPAVEDGFGVCYRVLNDRIQFVLSSFGPQAESLGKLTNALMATVEELVTLSAPD